MKIFILHDHHGGTVEGVFSSQAKVDEAMGTLRQHHLVYEAAKQEAFRNWEFQPFDEYRYDCEAQEMDEMPQLRNTPPKRG